MAIFPFFRTARRNRRCQLLRGHVPAIFTEFEFDADDLDDDAVAHTNLEHAIRHGGPHREQSMPLLIGLLDASVVRSSLDIPMGVDHAQTSSGMSLSRRRQNDEFDTLRG